MSDIALLPPRSDGFARKKWSVLECQRLLENGLLPPGKYELIEGEIVFRMGQGRLHIYVVARILAILTALFGEDSVQSQASVGIGMFDRYNDPEPDAAVVKGTLRDYLARDPDPSSDILLVVEASDSTLPGDTTTKAHVYARSGIQEYWVVAIPKRQLIVFRDPTPEGYSSVQTFEEQDTVSPLAAGESGVHITDLLP